VSAGIAVARASGATYKYATLQCQP
jgi:hypothetical protein